MGRTKPKHKGRSKAESGATAEASPAPKAPTADALLKKAQELIVQCDYELASKFANRILQQDPTNVEAKEILGVSLLETGEIDEAKQVRPIQMYSSVEPIPIG